jgi:hypothetical protein
MAKKTTCPITRKDFLAHAKPVTIQIGDLPPQLALPRQFSTNSLGWYLNNKTVMQINGIPVSVQIGINITVVGSKELPVEEGTAAPAPPPQENPAST